MKTYDVSKIRIKLFVVLIVSGMLMIPSFSLKSQESSSSSSSPSMMVYPTIGFGIGFFYPSDVNDYIEQEIISGYSGAYNTELYMYLEVKGGVTFRLKKVDFSALIEYDIAPKLVSVSSGDDFSYSFNRFSPEVSVNYYIPNKSGRNAFFIGGGINYSFMKFKEFEASSPGFKLQLGYSMQFGKFNLQPYGAFRYTKATDSSDATWGTMSNSKFDLEYTGGQFGVIMSFHKRMSYK